MIDYSSIKDLVETPINERHNFIRNLIAESGMIDCVLSFDGGANLFIEGNCNKFIMAHYDVVNKYNANDNSASVINALMYKKQHDEINVILTDQEEPPYLGKGSEDFIKNWKYKIDYIINLELTGIGRKVHTSNRFNNHITKKILKEGAVLASCPFSDSDIIAPRAETNVIWLTPEDDENIIYDCHTEKDTLDKIRLDDMKWFVEEYLPKVL